VKRNFIDVINAILQPIFSIILGISQAMTGIRNFAKKWPGAVYPLIVVVLINILTIFVFDVKDTIYQPLSAMLLWLMIGLQWMSLRKQIVARNKTRIESDKERLAGFFEAAGPNGIPGSIRFLSPFPEKWYNPIAWYRRIKGVTRLSVYRYGNTDHIGSYTKVSVDKKVLFQLLLMDCADTPNPECAVKGIDFIKENTLDTRKLDMIYYANNT